MALAFTLVVAVEWFSAVVHPFPADFDGNIPAHVRRYPDWVLGVVVLMWGATAAAATWVASRIGGRLAGALVTLLLASALAFNLSMLPYAMWFKIAMSAAFFVACLLGIRYGRRVPSPAVLADAAPQSNR
jgi:CHASE2 domain-containing sensor protein